MSDWGNCWACDHVIDERYCCDRRAGGIPAVIGGKKVPDLI